ncbi:MAG: adenylyltransferase/cytidyltransferase family protein [Nautiliaceae bacterium]
MIKGYTAGVFDLFHIGHLNILKKAKENCDYLIVAVSTDELVEKYKGKKPIIPYEERKAIVEAIKYVDEVVPQTDRDKIKAVERYDIDVMFVGSDWKGSEIFEEVDKYMKSKGKIGVKYFPYTEGVSSTKIKDILYDVYKQRNEK